MKSGKMEGNPEGLRSVSDVCKPDRRTSVTDIFTKEPITIQYQHDAVAKYVLHNGVPDDIRIQFETTKNLYLYAWFVYRFYPVAKLHAYTCLELALRERFGKDVIAARSEPDKRTPMLRELLSYVVKNEYLKNENFSVWQHHTEMRARERTKDEQYKAMERLKLSEMIFDDEAFEITEEDRNHDYLKTIEEFIPKLRNSQAHGSTELDKNVLGTIQLVAEIINQIYPEISQ